MRKSSVLHKGQQHASLHCSWNQEGKGGAEAGVPPGQDDYTLTYWLAAWAQGRSDQYCFLKNLYHPLRWAALSGVIPKGLCYSKKMGTYKENEQWLPVDSTQLGHSYYGRKWRLQRYLHEAHLLCTLTRGVVGRFHTSHCCANIESKLLGGLRLQ